MKTLGHLCIACLALCLACIAEEKSTWSRMESPIADPLHNGCFLDAEHGWIITYGTGLVLRTENGGDIWMIASRLDSIFYECVHFISKEKGWICGENGSLLQTEDGGLTWHNIKLAPDTYAFYGIYMSEQERGFLVGIDVSSRKAVFFESTDSGETWIERSNEVPGACFEPIQFLDANRGFMAGGNRVLRTTDGGRSWIACELDNKTVIRGLHFVDPRYGWAVGHGGDVFRTEDSGHTWQKSERFTLNRLRSVYFLDDKRGFIVGDQNEEPGSLWWTDDGGEKWSKSDQSLPDLHRLFRSPKALWAVGKSGTIMKCDY
ncbi:MAG: YCF48-related protein [bacterium]